MHRFMSSAASSSAGSAERPATVSGSCSSAQQPDTPILSDEQAATPFYCMLIVSNDHVSWVSLELSDH